MNSCPDCDKPLRQGATSCGCGWVLRKVTQDRATYSQCEWTTDTLRCRYPGSMSTNLACTGPWYCRLHYGERNPVFAAQIVQASLDYRHPTPDELDAEARARAEAYCRSVGMLKRDGESVESYARRRKEWLRERFTKVFKEAA